MPFASALRLCQDLPDSDERLCGVRQIACFNDVPTLHPAEDALG
jgi:hypothetical protein